MLTRHWRKKAHLVTQKNFNDEILCPGGVA
jgi:hypothetical protein